MKKAHYLFSLLFMLCFAAQAQTGWVTTKLDEKLSIKFPAAPEKTTTNGVDVYTYKSKDSVAYSAAELDLKVVANLDSATLASMKDVQQFADQIKMGMASKKTNYDFGDMVIGKWKTFTTYRTTGIDKANKNTLYTTIILIGSRMYTLSCRIPANMVTKTNDVFFDSAELLK